MTEALFDLLAELRRLGAVDVVITSDLPTRQDGLPYATGRAEDPGIAVWFELAGAGRVIACDRWATPIANVRAIGRSIEALRGMERWGATDMVARALQGFAALPAATGSFVAYPPDHWRQVLGVALMLPSVNAKSAAQLRSEMLGIARRAHRDAIKESHPDVGGDLETAIRLNRAIEEAERELGG
ncbi:MAG: hypothetical protein WA418_24510 [Bradyrhizobium sp.]